MTYAILQPSSIHAKSGTYVSIPSRFYTASRYPNSQELYDEEKAEHILITTEEVLEWARTKIEER